MHTLCLAHSYNMLKLVDHTLFFDQLYSHNASPSLLYNLRLPTHTFGAHTVLWSVVLLYIYILVKSLFTMGLCKQLHCTNVHSLVPAWPLFCQPITEELPFTCFALIGPLGVLSSSSLIAAYWHSPSALQNGLSCYLTTAIQNHRRGCRRVPKFCMGS